MSPLRSSRWPGKRVRACISTKTTRSARSPIDSAGAQRQGSRRLSVLTRDSTGRAGERGGDPATEGATAPETLRSSGPRGLERTLWKAFRPFSPEPPKG
ncbi:protein of unknown function [uncultured Sphingopyxis sp.]|uniref:Uncharacterized protein n=1 Tax=uncultured Sphingopyxis sp. TaxID=310581 RepID=A0A1Y5PPZ1_9SPHN|nr:protein of unknown function [uncultured Sphingopyxis sp.]